ncbi:MAG: SPOR domain-containing protein [Betaproteobacteria bacterium]|nr:SPOR domain-containing protein [Betaproteobacteria bacterium]
MRTMFFILVLANVAFFAFAWSGGGAEANGEAQIIGQQLNPEKIHLLVPEQVSALTRKPEPPKLATVCLEWGAFAGADAARAGQALEPLGLGAKLTQRKQEDVAGFWVYVPPLASRQAATQKAGELKRLGVDDYFVVPDDPKWRNAISLGVFKTEEAAKARLDALRAKGVKSATVGAREAQPGKTYFQVHEANSTLVAKLNELKQGFAGTEVRECAPDEKKG